jgi:hypothetical protein
MGRDETFGQRRHRGRRGPLSHHADPGRPATPCLRGHGVRGSITPNVTTTVTSGEGCEGRCLPVSLRACLDTSPFWS